MSTSKEKLKLFAEEMQRKVESKSPKYGDWWEDWTLEGILPHLIHEIGELLVGDFPPEECIDVANLCCMVYWKKLGDSGNGS